jgi:hypothetical protein
LRHPAGMWCVALRTIEVACFETNRTASLFIYFLQEHRHACCAPGNLGSVRARASPAQ